MKQTHSYRIAAAACAWLACTAFVWSQDAIDPREISVTRHAYVPPSQFTVKIDSRLVDLAVVVRDNSRHPVGELTQKDFAIRDNGKKREILAFTVQTSKPLPATVPDTAANTPASGTPAAPAAARPRFVGLVFDDLNTQFAEFRQAQTAAVRFVKEGLSANDRVGLYSTYGQQLLPFTTDRAQILAAVEAMRPRNRVIASGNCPQLTTYDAYLIANHINIQALEVKIGELTRCMPALARPASGGRGQAAAPPAAHWYDTDPATLTVLSQAQAVWQEVQVVSGNSLGALKAIVDHIAQFDGGRVLMLASGGFITANLEQEQDDVVRHALRAGVVINSLDAKGLYSPVVEMPRNGDSSSIIYRQSLGTRVQEQTNDVLANLSESTGGLFFHNNNDLDLGFHELGVIPEVTYLMGFAPDDSPDGKYHRIQVSLNRSGKYTVEARPGYFAARETPAAPKQERRIDREAAGSDTLTEIPVEITARPAKGTAGKSMIEATFRVDVKGLQFSGSSAGRSQTLTFLLSLADEQGVFVNGVEAVMQFAVKETTFTRLSNEGLTFNLPLEAGPGTYRARGLVAEAGGRIAAASQTVRVP